MNLIGGEDLNPNTSQYTSACIRKCTDYSPYVYVIQCTSSRRLYIGSRTQKGCDPSDLGSIYYTSSKEIKRKWKKHIDTYAILCIITCISNHAALELEQQLIVEHDAVRSPEYLNRSLAGRLFNMSGHTYNHTQEARAKISRARKGMKFSEEHRRNASLARIGKIRGPFTEEHKQRISQTKAGQKPTQQHNDQVSQTNKNKGNIECPHCGLVGSVCVMKQRHFDRCFIVDQSKDVYQATSPDGETYLFNSILMFARNYKLSSPVITNQLFNIEHKPRNTSAKYYATQQWTFEVVREGKAV